MADKVTYPKITRKIWGLLRARLKKAVPTTITPTYITSVSEMTEASARSNVIGPLRELFLIDENGKPTELMERWRHDDEYPKVCEEIRAKVYPHELIEAFPSPTPDQEDRIKNWFLKNAKVGYVAARMYTSTYVLLSERDASKLDDVRPKPAQANAKPGKPTHNPTRGSKAEKSPPEISKVENKDVEDETPRNSNSNFPSIHIDVQVHISPDTSSEQIDKIFESMSKHLTKFSS